MKWIAVFLGLGLGPAAAGEIPADNCAFCHGQDGRSGSPLWPNLAGLDEAYFIAQLDAFRAGSKGPRRLPESAQMYSIARNLSDQDIAALARYYAAQKPLPQPGEGDSRGAAIYADQCASCHGERAQGVADLNAPRLGGQKARYVRHQMDAYKTGQRIDPTGAMQPVTEALSEDDARAVARYLERLQ